MKNKLALAFEAPKLINGKTYVIIDPMGDPELIKRVLQRHTKEQDVSCTFVNGHVKRKNVTMESRQKINS